MGAASMGAASMGAASMGAAGGSSVATATDASVALGGCDGLGVGSWYLAAFSWSLMVITGTGGTDFYPSSLSDGDCH